MHEKKTDSAGWHETLKRAFGRPLPGRAAQELMVSDFRREAEAAASPGRAAAGVKALRPSAVLVLLYPDDCGRLLFPLVERSRLVGSHRGEIGLPGGSLEAGETPSETALREAGEELCLAPEAIAAIEMLGPLSPFPLPSGFELFPFVACLPGRPLMRPREGEIEGFFEAELAVLSDPRCVEEELLLHEGRSLLTPFFRLEGRRVWGATAMVLAELAELLRPFT